MRTRPKITSIEIIQYELTLQDVAPEPTLGIPVYKPGSVMQRRRHAIRIHSDIGVTGAYSGGSPMDYAAIAGFASCLLQLEHVRGLESHVDFIEAEATDFVRGDPDYDGGVTGVMKIAHAAEGFGLDVELHVTGPDRRHLMAAMRNTNYYEMGLLHPKIDSNPLRLYKDGYRDGIDAIDEHGCVDVPEGPGLGVEYDWDFILAHRTDSTVYK